MNTEPTARQVVIRSLAALLVAAGSAVGLLAPLVRRLGRPRELLRAVPSRTVVWPWLTQSSRLLIGTIAYNVFVLVVVRPVLRKWFPPLNPWEHVRGVFAGSTRVTFEDLVPVVGTTLWILGNGLLFALMNSDLRKTRSTPADTGTMDPLDATVRAGH